MTLIQGQKFKPYEYRPYPKFVKLKDGKSAIVNNLNEHEALQDKLEEALPAPEIAITNPEPATIEIAPVISTVTDKTALYADLDALGVIYDKRQSAAKLQEILNEALATPATPIA